MIRKRLPLTAITMTSALVATLTVIGPSAAAVPANAPRTETQVEVKDGVAISLVSLKIPAPASFGPHPEACDWISYLRFRPANGPTDPQKSDAVVVEQPGAFGSADNSDSLARSTVRSGITKGKNVEFWALARRGNCITDNVGLKAGWQAKDWRVAFDYYYNGKVIDGKKFGGFKTDAELSFLANMGVAQTVRDQYDLMLNELPDPKFRSTKAFCGGASLAGLMTGFFGAWDFDGNPATTADAGYNQCAGFFAIDTIISSDPVGLQTNPLLKWASNFLIGKTHEAVVAGIKSGVIPRSLLSVPGLNAEMVNAIGIMGIGAYWQPDVETDLHKRLPKGNLVTEAGLRFLFARTYFDFVAGTNDIRDFRFTNAALLGTLTDNNTTNLGVLQISQGAYTGGRVEPKSFPLPGDATNIPVIGPFLGTVTGVNQRVAPVDRNALYGWRNYDNVQGIDYTSPNDEVTDQRDIARQFGNPVVNSWELYFPVRTLVDFGLALAGARDGDLAAIQHAAATKAKPTMTIGASNSSIEGPMKLFFPPGTTTANGYTHIDTLTAAYKQNNGKPEPIGDTISSFAIKTAG